MKHMYVFYAFDTGRECVAWMCMADSLQNLVRIDGILDQGLSIVAIERVPANKMFEVSSLNNNEERPYMFGERSKPLFFGERDALLKFVKQVKMGRTDFVFENPNFVHQEYSESEGEDDIDDLVGNFKRLQRFGTRLRSNTRRGSRRLMKGLGLAALLGAGKLGYDRYHRRSIPTPVQAEQIRDSDRLLRNHKDMSDERKLRLMRWKDVANKRRDTNEREWQ